EQEDREEGDDPQDVRYQDRQVRRAAQAGEHDEAVKVGEEVRRVARPQSQTREVRPASSSPVSLRQGGSRDRFFDALQAGGARIVCWLARRPAIVKWAGRSDLQRRRSPP